MKKLIFIILFLSYFIGAFVPPASAQYDKTYNTLIQSGVQELNRKQYKKALVFFQSAYTINPQRTEAAHYINLLNRMEKGRIDSVSLQRKDQPIHQIPEPAERFDKINAIKQSALDSESASLVVDLDEQLWQQQPNTRLELAFKQSIIIRGAAIERYLVFEDGFLDIERIHPDQIKIGAIKRGGTFLHIWDQKGRWTFYIKIVLPKVQMEVQSMRDSQEIDLNEVPFRVEYSTTWSHLYRGDNLPDMERLNMSYEQWAGFFGNTPYGRLDGSLNFYQFEESTEIIGKSLGLTDGHIGPFNDFRIRGFDTSKEFSELSLPNRSFRGGLLDAYAFNRRIRYSLLQGQDRATFIYLAPEIYDERKSYLEGAQLTLFPDTSHQYSFNYARGYGEIRPSYLKNKVYSFETQHRVKNVHILSEIGYDEDKFASILKTSFRDKKYSWYISLRDINKDYYNVTGIPTNQGEVGGKFDFRWNPKTLSLNTNLDIFRDRDLYNAKKKDELNFDSSTSLHIPLKAKFNYDSSVYFRYTPQLFSPQNSLVVNNTLSHSFRLSQWKTFSWFLGSIFRRNRFEFSPESEYDQYGAQAGFRLPLLRNVSYFANYTYYWTKDLANNEFSQPHVLYTGISYSPHWGQKFSANFSLSYRNEENADKNFSFLAGEDSLIGNINLTFQPMPLGPDFFVDARVSNVWAENAGRAAYNEADIRCGMRASWDTPFFWNPQSEIYGKIFKDLNGNGVLDKGEPGLQGVKVNAGKIVLTTDSQGTFWLSLRKKKATIILDRESLPSGFVLTTPIQQSIILDHLKIYEVNFGVTTRSGIYGVVFLDKNGNKIFDENDSVVPNVRLILDGITASQSSYDGSYFFDNVDAGHHKLQIDISSIPIQFLPLVPLLSELEIQEGTTMILHVPLKENH